MTDAELVCLAVAQVVLRYDERHWLRAAPKQVGHLFPRLLRQSEYNARLKAATPLMEAALRWLADHTPATAEMLRLMDASPVPCGHSVITARRSGLFGWAGYGYCPSASPPTAAARHRYGHPTRACPARTPKRSSPARTWA
jgi:hypothetical protein